jgi:hypothetical protein
MSVVINRTNGAILSVIQDGTVDNTSDLALIGKNFTGYGELVNENLVKLLENFSNATAPTKAISGQLWWDTSNSLLKVYDGSAWRGIFASVTGNLAISNATASTTTTTGALTVAGGVGVVGNINAGNVAGTTLTGNVTSSGTSSFSTATISTLANVTATTASTTTTTGALRVAGGVGVVGNINAGNVAGTTLTGNVTSTGTSSFATATISTLANVTATTASTTTTSGALRVAGGVGVVGNLYAGGTAIRFTGNVASTSTTTGTVVITGGLGVSGALNVGGDVTAFATSDQRLKENVAVIESALEKVSSLRGVTFNWNQTARDLGKINADREVGVIAQDLEEVLPEVVKTRDDGYLAVQYEKLVPLLIESIKDLKKEIRVTDSQAHLSGLAENYRGDAMYEPGTVLEFGGVHEVTVAQDESRRVAGVVSTNPAYLMNSDLECTNIVPVAFVGRVPTKVRGVIRKGDLMVSAGGGYARPTRDPKIGTVIGKAIEDFDGVEGVIEIAMGLTS